MEKTDIDEVAAAAAKEQELNRARALVTRALINAAVFGWLGAFGLVSGLPHIIAFMLAGAWGFYACQALYRYERFLRIRDGVPL